MRILFVCLGNICRSPTAEAVLESRAHADLSLDSAGTGDWHVGKPPYAPMQDAARQRGINMEMLRARQVRSADFTEFDHIIAMDRQNLTDLMAMAPTDSRAKVSLLVENADVPDPYYTRDFDGALDVIEDGIDALVLRLGLIAP